MAITIAQIKELREATAAGMGACKEALTASNGDMNEAIKYLREKGLAVAAKRVDKESKQGIIALAQAADGKSMALAEVNCETDFVANTPEFKDMVNAIAKQVVISDPADVEALLACKMDGSEQTVNDVVTEKTAKIGEKISIRRFVRYHAEKGTVESYIHMGGKVGVLLLADCDEVNDAVTETLHDTCLQIAAASPVAPEYVTRDQVKAEHLAHETEILAAQARNEGKPEKIIEKMVQGRINKFYEEVCLLEQVYVKDNDLRVGAMIEKRAPGTKIVAFTRYKMGDGLEKKVSDLAAEVAEQIAKK